ncbi:MAG: hypothetical protein ACJAYM_002484 [Flavobacteriales bacterium]|jgi:hypothetical protein
MDGFWLRWWGILSKAFLIWLSQPLIQVDNSFLVPQIIRMNFDASGRLIWTSAKGVSQITLQGLSSGQYLFKVVYNEQEVKIQLIVE